MMVKQKIGFDRAHTFDFGALTALRQMFAPYKYR
jgi:hypothetical protein